MSVPGGTAPCKCSLALQSVRSLGQRKVRAIGKYRNDADPAKD
jgi:hypothetical protein